MSQTNLSDNKSALATSNVVEDKRVIGQAPTAHSDCDRCLKIDQQYEEQYLVYIH